MRLKFNIFLFLIVILAASLRLASYDFSLPYINHPDEPNYYLEALKWRGFYELGGAIPGYPPGILVINSTVQTLMADDGLKMPDVVRMVRLLSLVVNLMTLLIIAFIARRIAGFTAGLIAALSWGIAPAVVTGGVYATADPYVYFFTALAVWLALIALQDARRPQSAIWSIIAGLFAVLFKYPALPALLPGFVVAVYWCFTDRSKGVRVLAWQAGLVAGVGVFLLFIYQAGQMDIREADTLRTSGLSNLTNVNFVANNLFQVFAPIGGWLAVLIASIGLIRIAISDRFQQRTLVVLICLLPLIAIPWLAASFSLVTSGGRVKDVLPATAIAAALMGVGMIEISKLFRQRRIYAVALIVGLIAVTIWWPHLQADVEYVQAAQPADRRVDIRRWADENLTAGTVIVDDANDKTFNPQWSGLVNNRQWFDWLETDNVLEHTRTEWREDFGVSYLALNVVEFDRIEKTDAGQAFLEGLLPLREFTRPVLMRGPQTLFYRLWKPEQALDVTFGDSIHLIGYDVNTPLPAPGETLEFTFYWNATSAPLVDYSLFLHLLPDNESPPVAQYDGAPVSVERPTYTWNEPSETLISQPINLTLPETMDAGDYQLMMGLYDWSTLVRLPVTESGAVSGDAYPLLKIEVEN